MYPGTPVNSQRRVAKTPKLLVSVDAKPYDVEKVPNVPPEDAVEMPGELPPRFSDEKVSPITSEELSKQKTALQTRTSGRQTRSAKSLTYKCPYASQLEGEMVFMLGLEFP